MKKYLLLLPLLCLLASPVYAAIVCADAIEFATTSTTDPETISYTTPAGANQVLVVGVTMRDTVDTISGVTHAGNAMTAVTTEVFDDPVHVQQFYLASPTTGTNDVVVQWSGGVLSDAVVIVTCSGVNTADPIRAFNSAHAASGTDVTVTVADEVGDVTVDMYGGDVQTVEATEGADQTVLHKGLIDVEHGYGSSYQAGDGGVMSWTQNVSNNWAIMGVALKPAAEAILSAPPVPAVVFQ